MSIRATVTFINAQASANYVNVSAQDYVVRPQLVNSPFYFDTLPLSDVAVVLLTKPLSDSFAFTDLRIVNLSKLEADSLSFGDSVITATQMQRALSDNFGIGDSVNNINTGVNPTDTTTLLDLLSYNINKSLVDSTSINDLFTSLMSKIESDQFSFSDAVSIFTGRAVPITDNFSFSDAHLKNLGLGAIDSFSFNDIQSMQFNKIFSDTLVLDDGALVNKDFIGNRTDLLAFSDTISITRIQGRALGNMVLGSTQFN